VVTIQVLVRAGLIIETAVAGIMAGAIILVAISRRRRLARRSVIRQRVQALVIRELNGESLSPHIVGALRAVPRRDVVAVLAHAARTVGGDMRLRIAILSRQLQIDADAARELSSRRWWHRLRGARLLALVGPTPAQLRMLARDANPLVRAEGVFCASAWPDNYTASYLTGLRDDPAPFCRLVAGGALMRLRLAEASRSAA
jgi:hypothetical protein